MHQSAIKMKFVQYRSFPILKISNLSSRGETHLTTHVETYPHESCSCISSFIMPKTSKVAIATSPRLLAEQIESLQHNAGTESVETSRQPPRGRTMECHGATHEGTRATVSKSSGRAVTTSPGFITSTLQTARLRCTKGSERKATKRTNHH